MVKRQDGTLVINFFAESFVNILRLTKNLKLTILHLTGTMITFLLFSTLQLLLSPAYSGEYNSVFCATKHGFIFTAHDGSHVENEQYFTLVKLVKFKSSSGALRFLNSLSMVIIGLAPPNFS